MEIKTRLKRVNKWSGQSNIGNEGTNINEINECFSFLIDTLEMKTDGVIQLCQACWQSTCEFSQYQRHWQRLKSGKNFQPYLLPEDGVLFITTHGKSVTLEAQVHRRIMVPDIWHVLWKVKIQVEELSNHIRD